ncbi:Wzz/FepE/Etk N-terminal domain-containing protein [Williamsia phyllosphaerae]|uniref:Wzz/FepE/Etk N-terminal domain-containing protein n=1 Tax=Williamsia phyllosphaerae TaxID=885042 RepID=UPI001667E542
MEIGDYLRALRRFWWIVVVVAIVGAGAGYLSSLIATPKYASTAQLFVTTQSGTSVGDAYQNNLFSQERVVSYAALATSQQVAARAIDQLKSTISPDDLRSKITATPVTSTVLLNITATDSDPVAAQTYANAVSDQLVQLVSELETSRRGGTPAAGAVLVDDADYPSGASGLGLVTRIGLGLVGGLVLGVIVAILAALLDTRFRRRERVEEVAGSLTLGVLVDDKDRDFEKALDLSAGGLAVERLRELRTNLQFARTNGDRPKVISVTSPGHADGRSSTAVDLASVLAEVGRSVVLVDGDLVSPSLAERLGVGSTSSGLATVLDGQHPVSSAVITDVGGRRWALLPAGPVPSVRGRLWSDDRAAETIDALRSRFDYVIIDTPPLSDCADGALIAALGDGALVIARLGHTKMADLRRSLESLSLAHAPLIGTVVTGEQVGRRDATAASSKSDTPASPPAPASPPSAAPAAPPASTQRDPWQTSDPDSKPPSAPDRSAHGVHRVARENDDENR